MRCLGRLISLIVLLLLLAVGWLYRDELSRWIRGRIDPITIQRRIGHPSQKALASAVEKVRVLEREKPDSILLNADEMASLVAAGSSFLSGASLDSVSVELGDRTVRLRGLIDGTRIRDGWRKVIPLDLNGPQEVVMGGTISPVRPGVAEWDLDRVMLRGVPVPSSLIARAVGSASGAGSDGRLEITLPRGIQGFRVRPEGVTVYRDPGRK